MFTWPQLWPLALVPAATTLLKSPTLDPLLASLVSAFIVTAVIITLVLFLKLRKRNSGPEFHRLQDLPMVRTSAAASLHFLVVCTHVVMLSKTQTQKHESLRDTFTQALFVLLPRIAWLFWRGVNGPSASNEFLWMWPYIWCCNSRYIHTRHCVLPHQLCETRSWTECRKLLVTIVHTKDEDKSDRKALKLHLHHRMHAGSSNSSRNAR